MKFLSNELTAAETSFLKWQYGFDDSDEPFERALWQAIMRAWDVDHASGALTPESVKTAVKGKGATKARKVLSAGRGHLARLGAADVYPEHVALYLKFKSEGSDAFWDDLIFRAGLSDRRSENVEIGLERRRRA